MEWMLLVIPAGIGVFAIVFGLATLLVYNDGRGAYAREYIRRHRAERTVGGDLRSSPERRAAVRAELAKLDAAAARQRRPVRDPRRPVAAVTATPHAETDTRWSVLNGGRR